MEQKTIDQLIEEVGEKAKSAAVAGVEAKAKEVFEKEKKGLLDEIEGLKKSLQESGEKSATEKGELEKKLAKAAEDIEKLGVEFAKGHFTSGGKKISFKSAVKDAMHSKADSFKSLAGMTSGGEVKVSMKAATDENLDMSNFADDSYANLVTEQRGLYQGPFAPLWLRTLLPNATTTKAAIRYPRYLGTGDGAAGAWDGSPAIPNLTPKPGVNFDFDDITQNLVTIAGITRFKREMADDLSWLVPFISQQLITGDRGLFVAENAQIMTALDSASTDYDGDLTLLIEQIYEAAFGQLKDYYMNPSFIIMNSRDVITEIALNKASTSGLYNLPTGTVVAVNGVLTIGGLPVVPLPTSVVPKGTAYVVDRNQTQFVSRMSPELRFFEQDRDNVELNLITARAEERVATLIFNTKAIIKIAPGT